MNISVCVLGRQPALGLAELESLYGGGALRPLGDWAALLDRAPGEVAFERLGGTVKLAELITSVKTSNWTELEARLHEHLREQLRRLPAGKLTLGLSVYGLKATANIINKTTLALKKTVRGTGRPCRVVPNTAPALSSAQVLHNRLFTSHSRELILISDGQLTYLARTTSVQNIGAYAARDQARPKRDARVGMLPPKLAQIIVNLSVGKLSDKNSFGLDAAQGSQEEQANRTQGTDSERQTPADTAMRQENQRLTSSASEQADSPKVVLDPFCGTGVILQEALLMGYEAYGTDIAERMIEYSRANLAWLARRYDLPAEAYKLSVGDATQISWQGFDAVASETYLGKPLTTEPNPEDLRIIVRGVNSIHEKFLRNLAGQTKPSFRLCLAIPAWKTTTGFRRLPILDRLHDLGYTRQSFSHVRDEDLLYHRKGQLVARELVVLIKL